MVWSVWHCWMVSPSCHHVRLLYFSGILSLLKLLFTRKNINDRMTQWQGNLFSWSEIYMCMRRTTYVSWVTILLQELTKSAQNWNAIFGPPHTWMTNPCQVTHLDCHHNGVFLIKKKLMGASTVNSLYMQEKQKMLAGSQICTLLLQTYNCK
jgi:hypothetical protein